MQVLLKQKGKHPQYVFTYFDKSVKQCNTKAWKNALARAGIKNFRWHDLRHTWASWHVQNGTSLQELQQLGGWSSFEMVLRYAHLSSDHLKSAAERVRVTNWLQSKVCDPVQNVASQ
jgi:integrase